MSNQQIRESLAAKFNEKSEAKPGRKDGLAVREAKVLGVCF